MYPDIQPEGFTDQQQTAFDLIESTKNIENQSSKDKTDEKHKADDLLPDNIIPSSQSLLQSHDMASRPEIDGLDILNMQSVIDPDRKSMLMNYGLDQFKNSIWENFLGSQVQVSSVIDPDGSSKVSNQNIDKMGPI